MGEVDILICELMPKDIKTYRHFEAEIAVCKKIAEVNLEDLPIETKEKLLDRGELTLTDPSSIPEKIANHKELLDIIQSKKAYVKIVVRRT